MHIFDDSVLIPYHDCVMCVRVVRALSDGEDKHGSADNFPTGRYTFSVRDIAVISGVECQVITKSNRELI